MRDPHTRIELLRLLVTGTTLRPAVKALGISRNSVYRYVKRFPRFKAAIETARKHSGKLSEAEIAEFLAAEPYVETGEPDHRVLAGVPDLVLPVVDSGGGKRAAEAATEAMLGRARIHAAHDPSEGGGDVVEIRTVVVPEVMDPGDEPGPPKRRAGPSIPKRSHKAFLDKVWEDYYSPHVTVREKIASMKVLAAHYDTVEKKRALIDVAEAQARGGAEETSRGLTAEAKRRTIHAIIGPPPDDEPADEPAEGPGVA